MSTIIRAINPGTMIWTVWIATCLDLSGLISNVGVGKEKERKFPSSTWRLAMIEIETSDKVIIRDDVKLAQLVRARDC